MGIIRQLNVFLEEFAEALIFDQFSIKYLYAEQAHGIMEKCGFMSIGEPLINGLLSVKRTPSHKHITMGVMYMAIQVNCPTVFKNLLFFFFFFFFGLGERREMRLRTITPWGAMCGTPVQLTIGPICPLDKDPPDYCTKTPLRQCYLATSRYEK